MDIVIPKWKTIYRAAINPDFLQQRCTQVKAVFTHCVQSNNLLVLPTEVTGAHFGHPNQGKKWSVAGSVCQQSPPRSGRKLRTRRLPCQKVRRKGDAQGGVLSLLLWNIAVDSLLKEIDDIAIPATGKHLVTLAFNTAIRRTATKKWPYLHIGHYKILNDHTELPTTVYFPPTRTSDIKFMTRWMLEAYALFC